MTSIDTNKIRIVCGCAEPSYRIPTDIKAADWEKKKFQVEK